MSWSPSWVTSTSTGICGQFPLPCSMAFIVASATTAVFSRSSCHDGETGLPFVLAADLLRTALAIRPELPDALPAQTAAMAGRLVPALAASDSAAPAAPPVDSPMAVTRLYAAITDTLRATATPQAPAGPPGIVVVEDVQWADSSSLGLLAYLVRRLADGPLLLVLSWQPEQAGRLRGLRTALAEAESQSMGETIEPGPLGPEAIGTLLGLGGMPPIDVDRLLAETRGLPMLVREYVEAFRDDPGRPTGGRPPACGTRRHERDPATSGATTWAATVAGHLQLAGRDGEAAQWWWRAAEVARELYAHAEAHTHLTRALALGYPQLPGRIALAEVLVALGRYREALTELETAAAIAAGDEPVTQAGPTQAVLTPAVLTQAGIEHKLADVHHRLGDWELAEAHLAVVTELIEGTEPGLLARAQADRAVVAYRRGATGQTAELGQAALDSARAAADPGDRPGAQRARHAGRAGRGRRRGRTVPAGRPGPGPAAAGTRRGGGGAEQPGPAAGRNRRRRRGAERGGRGPRARP